jgi:hypothetical protein
MLPCLTSASCTDIKGHRTGSIRALGLSGDPVHNRFTPKAPPLALSAMLRDCQSDSTRSPPAVYKKYVLSHCAC